MNCNETRKYVARSLVGWLLGKGKQSDILDHLAGCIECEAAISKMRNNRDLIFGTETKVVEQQEFEFNEADPMIDG